MCSNGSGHRSGCGVSCHPSRSSWGTAPPRTQGASPRGAQTTERAQRSGGVLHQRSWSGPSVGRRSRRAATLVPCQHDEPPIEAVVADVAEALAAPMAREHQCCEHERVGHVGRDVRRVQAEQQQLQGPVGTVVPEDVERGKLEHPQAASPTALITTRPSLTFPRSSRLATRSSHMLGRMLSRSRNVIALPGPSEGGGALSGNPSLW